MAARPLSEAVQQAEEAISGGNYRLAVETCRRVLGQFPEFATAHRLLAEAHLEEGDVAGAERAFNETLQRDPQSSAAYAGLATIAEQRGDTNTALAYAQAAWEISPQRADLRDRVAGLSERVYGKGGRLHLTRAALTSLHFRAGRWSRAAAEAAAVLAEHPARVDVHLRMAESLWRRGSLPAASNACRAVLESAPSAVMALLMQADIERRQGNQEAATQLLERARAIDPDGVRASDLVTVGETELAEFILPSGIPQFDDAAEVTAEVERPRIAPAPDFSWTEPAQSEARAETETDRMVSESPATPGASTEEESVFEVGLPDDAEIEAARPPAAAQHGYTSMLQSLEGEGLKPFRLEGDDGDESDDELTASASTDEGEDVFSLVSDEEIDAARPPTERPHGYTTLLNSLGESGLSPFEVEGEPGYPTEPEDAPVETSASAAPEPPASSVEPFDYGTDLTAGWDDIDAEIERATPTDDPTMSGYTGELRDLDVIGVEPFSIDSVEMSKSAEQEFADDVELDAAFGEDLSFLDSAPEREIAAPVPVSAESGGIDLTDGWATIDEEIQNAIPTETPPGYTDELNELTESGVEPFFVDAGDSGVAAEDDEVSAETEEYVPDDLAAGLDLWSIEGEPAESAVAATEAFELVDPEPEPVAEPEIATETVTEADLFDFADADVQEEAPVAPVEAAETSETDQVLGWGAALTEEPAPIEEPLAASLVEPVTEDMVVEHFETIGTSPLNPSDTSILSAISHLGVDAALFDRSREGKMELVNSGQIDGNLLLPGVEPPGPTLDDLQQMVQESPADQALRRQYAEALLESEAFEQAFNEYHWMFRQRMDLDQNDLSNLSRVAENGGAHEMAGHRLLGAVYRRAGNFGMSARHYQLSLAGQRADSGKEA